MRSLKLYEHPDMQAEETDVSLLTTICFVLTLALAGAIFILSISCVLLWDDCRTCEHLLALAPAALMTVQGSISYLCRAPTPPDCTTSAEGLNARANRYPVVASSFGAEVSTPFTVLRAVRSSLVQYLYPGFSHCIISKLERAPPRPSPNCPHEYLYTCRANAPIPFFPPESASKPLYVSVHQSSCLHTLHSYSYCTLDSLFSDSR